jgi:hypothetical protein
MMERAVTLTRTTHLRISFARRRNLLATLIFLLTPLLAKAKGKLLWSSATTFTEQQLDQFLR